MKSRLALLFAFMLVFLSAPVGASDEPSAQSAASPAKLPWEDARRFVEALEKIRAAYVEPIDDETLFRLAIQGMANGLDPYSAYLDAAQHEQLRIDALGRYEGLGIEVAPLEDGFTIVAPLDGGPAKRAGLQAGDRLLRANGAVLDSVDVATLDRILKGPVGGHVTLTVQRGEQRPFDVTLTREVINIPSVRAERLQDGLVYLRIAHFSDGSARDVARVLTRTGVVDQKARGLILDLRDNAGGVVEGAIAIADEFLDRGVIVSTQGRLPVHTKVFEASLDDLAAGTPMIVLVNHGTASAAEILAGALQDNGRAVLLGQRTFGKGVMQALVPLEGGGALKITTAYYRTPAGRTIQGSGIAPDLEAKVAEASKNPREDQLVQRAAALLTAGEVRP